MGRKRRRGFLCFGGSPVEEDEMEDTRRRFDSSGRSDEASPIERSRNRRCSFSRALSKILKPLALLASSRRSRKIRRDSNRFIKQKEAESSTKSTNSDEDRRPQAICTFSPASRLSSSSPSSSHASSPISSCSTVSALPHLLPWVSGSADAKKLSFMQIARSKKPLPLAMARVRNYRPITASFLVLSSLTLMVFYGRLCAILWVSSWFCYVARRSGAVKEKARGGVALRPAAAKAAEIKRRNWEVESCF